MYVRVEVNKQRQFVEIDNIDKLTLQQFIKKGKLRNLFSFMSFDISQMFYIETVVDAFVVKDAIGRKVYIFDQLDTRVDSEEILKYLISSNSESLILKVQFNATFDTENPFRPKVWFSLCLSEFIIG